MAHVLADTRPRFNSYPTAINTQYAPPSKQYAYHYAPATPATTPTKSQPGSSYPYRQASNPSQSRLASAPVTQQSSSSRAGPTRTSSVPNPRPSTSSAAVPAPRSTNPLPAAPEAYSHSRKGSMSRPSQSQPPTTDAYRAAKREDERYASTRQQQQQQYADAATARQARLIAERDATLKRMEARQRKAQAQTWFEEGQRLAQEAARKQQDEERRRAEEKLRRAAQAQADEERKLHARKHERGRSQTHNPGVPSTADGKKWYQGWFREKSRDGRGRKDDRGSDREQRGERERAKSEGRVRDANEARERIEKDRARNAMSEGAVAAAWTTYEKACAELMDAKPTKGKPLSSNLTFYDIPWPVLGTASSFHDLTTQNIAAFLLSPHHSNGKSRRARLRAAILIWHPDKFAQKVLPRVAESHRPAVVAAVNVVARIVTELISADGN
jgi:hypothetical protein